MPPPPLRRTLTEVPQQASSPLWSSKVQMSEDTESGAMLVVFRVHENHIVNSTSQQWDSDPFFVNIHSTPVEFRVRFIAKHVAESKTGLSFKKAKGLCNMELACVGEPPEGNRFRVAFLVGPGVTHDSLGNNSGTIATVATTSGAALGEAARRITRREAQHSHDFGKYPTLGPTGMTSSGTSAAWWTRRRSLSSLVLKCSRKAMPLKMNQIWIRHTHVHRMYMSHDIPMQLGPHLQLVLS